MKGNETIQYLDRQEIDSLKWNLCIEQATNGRVYAYSDYLDQMADNWSALVLNDYEAVMPLPWRKKMGIHYIYQPFLTAQLGLFGNRLSASLLKKFLDSIPKKFRLWEFPLNQENLFEPEGYLLHKRVNYLLPLQKDYSMLQEHYRDNVKRNIRKSISYGCALIKGTGIEEVISLARLQHKDDEGFKRFESLFNAYLQKGKAVTYAMSSAKNELLASCALVYSHKRIYYLLVGNHPNGRTLGASHALVDAIIKDHAGKDVSLDFEGSDIRNLAFFYSGFGAQEEHYTAISMNKLPWMLRIFKRLKI